LALSGISLLMTFIMSKLFVLIWGNPKRYERRFKKELKKMGYNDDDIES